MTTEGTGAGLPCATCGGDCTVDADRRGPPHIKCGDCGAQFEVILAPVPRAKWTLVGPSGKLASFSSSEALRDAVERTVEFGTSESAAVLLPVPDSSEDVVAKTPPPDESSARLLPETAQQEQEEDDDEAIRVETKEIVVVDLLTTTPTAPYEKKPSLLVEKKPTPMPPPPDSEDDAAPVSFTDVLEIRSAPAPEIKRSVPPTVTRASHTPAPPPKPSAAPKPHAAAKLELEVESEPRVPAA